MTIDSASYARQSLMEFTPPVQSLMDIDFYKFTMGQMVLRFYPDVEVTFQLIIRDKEIPLADGVVDEGELRSMLDYARTLSFRHTDLYYLRGMDVYGKNMFSEEYLEFLKNFKLPPFNLRRRGASFELKFSGPWAEVSLWETIALAIISELYYRALMRKVSERTLEVLYARAKSRLYEKLEVLAKYPGIRFADFGQRRRHSFLWQKWVLGLCKEAVPRQLVGTSNTWMAFHYDFVPIGTNAHEIPQTLVALEDSDERKRAAQYDFLKQWEELYGQGLRIFLPDTYGTEQFLAGAPAGLESWRGFRQDSGDPVSRGEAYIAWLKERGVDPSSKLIIFSDGLDVGPIIRLYEHFHDRIPVSFGWGTLLTNDFRDCYSADPLFRPFSMVCKVVAARRTGDAEWRSVVKLSDNINKVTGPKEEIERYMRIFGNKGRVEQAVLV